MNLFLMRFLVHFDNIIQILCNFLINATYPSFCIINASSFLCDFFYMRIFVECIYHIKKGQSVYMYHSCITAVVFHKQRKLNLMSNQNERCLSHLKIILLRLKDVSQYFLIRQYSTPETTAILVNEAPNFLIMVNNINYE